MITKYDIQLHVANKHVTRYATILKKSNISSSGKMLFTSICLKLELDL